MWMGVVIGMFLRAILATLIGLAAIGHSFWTYVHFPTRTVWDETMQIELYGGILLVCVGLFSAILNYRRLRKRIAERQQSTKGVGKTQVS